MRRKERVNCESGVVCERVLWATLGVLICCPEVAVRHRHHWNPATALIRERVLWATLAVLIVVVGLILLVGGC